MTDDVAGMAIHIGARVAALADANETLVSSTVKDLVSGSGGLGLGGLGLAGLGFSRSKRLGLLHRLRFGGAFALCGWMRLSSSLSGSRTSTLPGGWLLTGNLAAVFVCPLLAVSRSSN